MHDVVHASHGVLEPLAGAEAQPDWEEMPQKGRQPSQLRGILGQKPAGQQHRDHHRGRQQRPGEAERRDGAPGVYVADAKIAALGLLLAQASLIVAAVRLF